jgi:hypothetical protein
MPVRNMVSFYCQHICCRLSHSAADVPQLPGFYRKYWEPELPQTIRSDENGGVFLAASALRCCRRCSDRRLPLFEHAGPSSQIK